jgi:MraZ protein
MFMGQYEHSIDAKGRAIVPAKYREELGDVFYVTRGADGCLYLYPQKDWEALAQKLQSLTSSQQSRYIQRQLMASASEMTLDKQGRILIPAKLRGSANLTKELVFVGMINHVEIWDKDTFEAQSMGDEMSMEEAMDALGISL